MRGSSRTGTVPVVALLAAAVLAACGTAPLPASPSPTVSVAPTPAPTSEPSPSPGLSGWLPVGDTALAGLQPTDLVWTGERFVAVGTLDGRSVVVVSTDGWTWTRAASFAEGAVVHALAADAGMAVAVGAVRDRPTIWFSPDGVVWQARTPPVAPRSRGQGSIVVTDVLRDEQGWLAVGREDPQCSFDCGVEPLRALAWRSVDGLRWVEAPERASLQPGGMNVVVRWRAAYLAAGVADRGPVIWTSTDGRTWSRIHGLPVLEPNGDPSVWTAIVAADAADGVIVCVADSWGYGAGGAPVAVVWSSSDGETWQRGQLDDATPVTTSGIVRIQDGWLLAGRAWNADLNRWVGVAWASRDGRAWTVVSALSEPPAFIPTIAAASASVEVALGIADAAGPGPRAAVWWRPVR